MAQDAPIVSVTVGDVFRVDNNAKFIREDTSSVWTDYVVINRYENNGCVYMMGVTSPNGFQNNGQQDTVAFVQLASPMTLWIMDWTCSRFKEKPKIPDPKVQDPRWKLLDQHYEWHNEVLGPDGITPLYRLSGTYVYGCTKPNSDPILDTVIPRPPWMQDFDTRTLTTAVFERGLGDAGYNLRTR